MRDIDVTSHLREIASVLCKLKSDEEEEKRRRLLPTACEFTLINVFVFLAKFPFRVSLKRTRNGTRGWREGKREKNDGEGKRCASGGEMRMYEL